MSNLFQAWLSGRTVRKHTMYVHRHENTAEHTWGMLMLLVKYWPEASVKLYRRVTIHDSGEQGACDIPAHICWEMPELKEAVQIVEDKHVTQLISDPYQQELDVLTPDEELVLEIVDRAEFALSCWYEYQMGNRLVASPLARSYGRVLTMAAKMAPSSPLKAGAEYLSKDLMRVTAEVQPQTKGATAQ